MPEEKSTIVGWAQVISTIIVSLVGVYFTQKFSQEQEETRNTLAAMQLMSQREQSELDFRQKAFALLNEKLLNTRIPLGNRLATLRLFQENFNSALNSRLLFDALELEAEKAREPERDHLIGELLSIAKAATRAQEMLLGVKPDKLTKDMTEGESVKVHLKFEEGHHKHKGSETHEGGHEVDITLKKVQARAVIVDVMIDRADQSEYEVSYFDQPFTDNTLLPDGHRFAITLKDIDREKHKATLSVFEFPAHYLTPGYRPTFDEAYKAISQFR